MPNDPSDQLQQSIERPESDALNTPDVQSVCNADASQIREIQLLNPDKHDGSAGGKKDDSLRIESDGKVIAARGFVASTPQDSISLYELRDLADKPTGGYPWAGDCLKKWEAAQQLPEGAARENALAVAQDMADLMARRGPYALKDGFSKGSAHLPVDGQLAYADGLNHEKTHKLTDSYSLALSTAMGRARDLGEAQQIQAQVSIDYMTKKGEEALAALQANELDKTDSPLVAWSTVELPKEIGVGENVEIRLDATNAVETEQDVLAQKPLEKYYLEHPEAAPIQIPRVNVGEVAGIAVQSTAESMDQALRAIRLADKATYRSLDYPACQDAMEKFPDLKHYGVNEKVIAAIILNELVHRGGDDDDEDNQIRKNGHVLNSDGSEDIKASIGPAQIQVQNIHRLAEKYPQLSLYNSDASRAALEPSIAPYFVAAYLQERMEAFSAHDKANPTEQTPKCFESLLYTYNPDVVSKVRNSAAGIHENEYREISASEKIEEKLTGHRAGSLTGWKSESYPRNQMILQKSGVVKTIKQTIQAVETHFRDK